jgi:prepilin signal peptidase PulO-like enzyme (type II secretory pathway)
MLTIFATSILFVWGLCIGSFINALNYRIVHGKGLTGRSFCPHCKHKLGPKELIPLLSYLAQAGKCLHCKKRISPRYPLVELTTAFVFAIAAYQVFLPLETIQIDPVLVGLQLVFLLFIGAALVGVAAADFSWGIIPDKIVFPAIVVTLLYRLAEPFYRDLSLYFRMKNDPGIGPYLLESGYFSNIVNVDIQTFLFALLVGGAIALFFYSLIFFTRGRGMGLGDVKLGFLIGFALGWPAAVTALFLAFLTGALVSTILILVRRKRFGDAVPFGPFLALGALASLFWGQQILEFYLRLFQ